MQLTDSREIAASPGVVWKAIFDPDVLKECIPGCESMSGSLEEGYEAVVVQKVGPVKARFAGTVSLTDIRVGEGVTISGEGKGGAAGYARGSAKVTLTPEGEGTLLGYEVEAAVGGKLAQLGGRIVDGVAKKMADQFFERFAEAVGGPKPDAAEAAEAEAGQEAGAPKRGWFSRVLGRKPEEGSEQGSNEEEA